MLSAMDIYCQPSIFGEFFPNAIIEAMAMGKPWIGSDIAGLKELTAGDSAGWVSPPGDVDALAANLDRLAGDAELRASRGRAARKHVQAELTIEKVVDRILGAYRAAGAAVDTGLPRQQVI
jgi:glycosyltransferase involved in cell wall biosynthesis